MAWRPEQPELPQLPPVARGGEPAGYRRGWQIRERLQGLGLAALGVIGLLAVYALFRLGGNLPGAPEPPPAPGVLKGMQIPPLLSAANCLSPMVAIASVGLILVGLRQMVDPQ